MLAVWAFWLEPSSLRVRAYRLEIPNWDPKLSGLRIAVLGDLHVGSSFNGVENLRRVVQRTNQERPALILIAGDFVITGVKGGHFVPPETIAAELGKLSAPLGVYAVLGNHDWWLDAPRVRKAVESAGIPILDDRAVEMTSASVTSAGGHEEPHFWLVGAGDYLEAPHRLNVTLATIHDDRPILVLTHNPDLFPDVPGRVNLTIAAHTHGGQVYIPLIGRPIVPSMYGQRFAIGHIVEAGRHLFVTPGIGTSIIPVRFLVPPEISLLELWPAS